MEHDSKERILQAAIKIFTRKGKHGARMEEVAGEANINKAMVYYYFSTKDNLYFEVLKTIVFDLFNDSQKNLNDDISSGMGQEEIISRFIRNTFERLNNNPDYIRILIDALSNSLDEIPKAMELIHSTSNMTPISVITGVIQDGIEKKKFRNIDPKQTFISITGLIFIYFLSRTFIKIFDVKIDDEENFIKNRLNSIVDLIMNGILTK